MADHITASELLESEHRWINGLFETFRRDLTENRVDPTPFMAAAPVLRRHIYLEDDVVFPYMETYGEAGPAELIIPVMVQQHGTIWSAMDKIEDMLRQGAEPKHILEVFEGLRSLLEEHNVNEEQILYPVADQLLGLGAADESGIPYIESAQAFDEQDMATIRAIYGTPQEQKGQNPVAHVLHELRNARLPDGWVCRARRTRASNLP